jgi:uncharacterized protein (DUF885 family)
MNSSDKYNKRQNNRKKRWVWASSIILVILLIAFGMLKGIPNYREAFEKANSESCNTEKVINIAPTPSITTLNDIENWVNKEEKDGEKFKNYNYAITQYYGIHISMVDAVLSQIGEVKDKNDAENLIALFDSYSGEFENSLNAVKENENKGVIPPKFIITQVESQIIEFSVKDIKKNNIYLAFKKKLQSLNISDGNEQKLLMDMEKVIKECCRCHQTETWPARPHDHGSRSLGPVRSRPFEV